jgi:hypothetical protein
MHFTRLSLLSVVLCIHMMPSSWGCWFSSSSNVASAMPEHLHPLTNPRDRICHRRQSSTSSLNLDHNDSIRTLSSSSSTCCRCHVYIWDALSSFKYHHVKSQLQKFTIEGKGGKKFIRIPHNNSILKTWYPQLLKGKLKPNKCWICGHSWADHLKHWWDRRRMKGDVGEFDKFARKSSCATPAFYKHYVQEAGKNQRNITRRRIKENEIRLTLDGRVSFGSLVLLALARIQSLAKVEELIWLSDVETSRRTNDRTD